MNDPLTSGGLIGALLAAIGWLARKLYDAPRVEELTRIAEERDELRKLVDATYEESKKLLQRREEELEEMRRELRKVQSHLGGLESRDA